MISKLRIVREVTGLNYWNLDHTRDWTGIVYHHFATPDGERRDARSVQRYHIEENGWSDIGYHFVVERYKGAYVIIEARPLIRIGAHTKGYMNRVAIGVALAGNFDKGYPDIGQIILARKLTLTLRARFKIPVPKIRTHSEFSEKSCPGNFLPPEIIRLFFA